MKKKINIIRIIDILYWTLVIMMALLDTSKLKTEFSGINFESLTLEQYITVIINMIPIIMLFCIINMAKLFYITVIYFGIKIANRKHKKERTEKVDLKNETYYKEILPKYSPAVLSYVDDFKIAQEDVVATLLMLELKGKIHIQEEDIVVLDETIEQLEKNEIFILNSVKNKTLKDINIFEFSRVVKEDALKQGLLQEKRDAIPKMIKQIIIRILILCFSMPFIIVLASSLLKSTNNSTITIIILSVLIMVFGFGIFAFYTTISSIISYKILNKLDPYIRNDEGKMINKKLEGLRKYLIDYSKIDEKAKEHLILWEDYLIYSVILGVNKKIVEEINNKIK